MSKLEIPVDVPAQRQFPCKSCGATLSFAPGTSSLTCPYCGAANEIDQKRDAVGEQDFNAYFDRAIAEAQTHEQLTVHCQNCGAETTLKPDVTAGRCPFCGSSVVAEASSKKLIRPQALLPFHVTKDHATQAFRDWIASLWFAPSELARRAEASQITGVYIPAWTYDAHTQTDYTGQRGEDYWDTETYTTFENGRSVTRTRQVRKTRWWPASGTVSNSFDDLLVLASRSLPIKYANKLEPWDLNNLAAYQDEFLSGFVAESYQIGLPEGFETAKVMMQPKIRQTICQDIGGDHQRISSVDTQYSDVTFKHLLLPVWISAYLYRDHTYHFLVNARTGEVQGERPWSWIKIALLILAILLAIAIVLLIVNGNR
jgi:LSD1 subclass zinc finger protein